MWSRPLNRIKAKALSHASTRGDKCAAPRQQRVMWRVSLEVRGPTRSSGILAGVTALRNAQEVRFWEIAIDLFDDRLGAVFRAFRVDHGCVRTGRKVLECLRSALTWRGRFDIGDQASDKQGVARGPTKS
jgi:hypothetical protein